MDVGRGDAHDNDRAGPLHETEEEEDQAKGRIISSKLECHCAWCDFTLTVQNMYARESSLKYCVERLMLLD